MAIKDKKWGISKKKMTIISAFKIQKVIHDKCFANWSETTTDIESYRENGWFDPTNLNWILGFHFDFAGLRSKPWLILGFYTKKEDTILPLKDYKGHPDQKSSFKGLKKVPLYIHCKCHWKATICRIIFCKLMICYDSHCKWAVTVTGALLLWNPQDERNMSLQPRVIVSEPPPGYEGPFGTSEKCHYKRPVAPSDAHVIFSHMLG